MFRRMSFMFTGLVLAVGAACGSSPTGGTGTPTPVVASPSPVVSVKPPSYDPCVLVTAQEASALTGISYGAGKEELHNATKGCVYGAQTLDVFTVGILQAPDAATAQAAEVQGEAALQKAAAVGASVTHLQGVGDAAVEIQSSTTRNGTKISICGIYVVKGAIFFFISDAAVNHAVPSNAALQGQATTVLTRL